MATTKKPTATADDAPMLQSYDVLSNLDCDGVRYGPGEPAGTQVQLSDATALPLLAACVVKLSPA